MVSNNLSFYAYSSQSFQDLLYTLNPVLPRFNRNQLHQEINTYYTEQLALFKDILQDQKRQKQGFSLCIDIWTSKSQHAFLGITIHWIDKYWTLNSRALRLLDLRRRHTGKYMYRCLCNVLEELDIQQNIIAISHDNASNNATLLNRFNDLQTSIPSSYQRVSTRCSAHILNLVVQDILTAIKVNIINSEEDTLIEDADILETPSNLDDEGAHELLCFGSILKIR